MKFRKSMSGLALTLVIPTSHAQFVVADVGTHGALAVLNATSNNQLALANQALATANVQARANAQVDHRYASEILDKQGEIYDNLDDRTKKEEAEAEERRKKKKFATVLFIGLTALAAGGPK
ncbi:hypothetical protein [Cupriavidus necator]